MSIDPLEHRKADHPIDEMFLKRWSPRAMSGAALSDAELNTLFEAARWAPSSYNEQPWTFLYARRDTAAWDKFFTSLIEFNQGWCKNAAVLVAVVARLNFGHNNTPNVAHLFDCGTAWGYLALQASKMGLVSHGMTGVDFAKAKQNLSIPDDHVLGAFVALGKPGALDVLPEPMRAREVPSSRKPISAFAIEGGF